VTERARFACAAALASLDLFAAEQTLETVARTDKALHAILAPLRAHRAVADIRQVAPMIGIDLEVARIDAASAPTPAWRIANDLYVRWHFTRPIGTTIQLVPPLVATSDELRAFAAALVDALDSAAR
jgi:adenosylmethionine---8-amino-7-oxononanoate aminotransferase